jgi:predicted nicotinamide N-methyase
VSICVDLWFQFSAMTVPSQLVDLSIEDIGVRLWRAIHLEEFVDGAALLRDDDPPEPPYWMHLWPGALALARRLASVPALGPGARLLELGCGLGLPALVAARRGATVVASDRCRAPLDFVRRSAAASGCGLELVQMDWAAPALRGGFDFCVGADIAYDAAAEEGVVGAVERVLAPGGMLWLSDSVNTVRASLAARLVAAGFAIEVRMVREYEDGRPVWVRVMEGRHR